MADALREMPLGKHAALLLVDVQNYTMHPQGGLHRGGDGRGAPTPYEAGSRGFDAAYFWRSVDRAVANAALLQKACRDASLEVVFTVIESLTKDGRERSLDYKISKLHVPRGSWDAQVLEGVKPLDDEIVLPKSSCSCVISTNLTYVLRNLGVEQVIVVGGLADQCVESAVRDLCDSGFLVTLVTDAVVSHSKERMEASFLALTGFCRQRTTDELVAECKRVPTANTDSTLVPPPLPGAGIGGDGTIVPPPLPPTAAGDDEALATANVTNNGSQSSDPILRALAMVDLILFEAIDIQGVGRSKLVPSSHAVRSYLDPNAHILLFAAFEYEFSLAAIRERNNDSVVRPMFRGVDIFASYRNAELLRLFAQMSKALAAVGIPVLTMNPEYGEGQVEVTVAPNWDVHAGDTAWLFKRVVKEWTRIHGAASLLEPLAPLERPLASFMCRPYFEDLGLHHGASCGGHLNFSLWSADHRTNLFEDPSDKTQLSALALQFLAGVLHHAAALQAFAAPTIDSYWRVSAWSWAPTHATWGFENRTVAVRVVPGSNGDGRGTRFEWRQPSAAANPYIAQAAFIAAGTDGILRGLQPPDPLQGSAYNVHHEIDALPNSLCEAIAALREDCKLTDLLGESFVKHYLHSVETEELMTCPKEFHQQDARVAHAILTGNKSEIEKAQHTWGAADARLHELTPAEVTRRSEALAAWCVSQYAELR